jgi:hypothetical protein
MCALEDEENLNENGRLTCSSFTRVWKVEMKKIVLATLFCHEQHRLY